MAWDVAVMMPLQGSPQASRSNLDGSWWLRAGRAAAVSLHCDLFCGVNIIFNTTANGVETKISQKLTKLLTIKANLSTACETKEPFL